MQQHKSALLLCCISYCDGASSAAKCGSCAPAGTPAIALQASLLGKTVVLPLQIVASGRRRHFYIYDVATSAVERVSALLSRHDSSVESFAACSSSSNPLVAFLGNEGSVPLVSLRSRQSVGALKMNGTVRTAAFSSDGAELLTSGAKHT